MADLISNDRKFKEAIGAFIIAFSELEFGLGILCSFTEFDLRRREESLPKYLGYSLEQKRKTLTEFIKDNLPDLSSTWTKINSEIGSTNRERRFVAHGFMTYYLPFNESITTYIKEGKRIVEKEIKVSEIHELTNKLHHLNTGENGINGEFHTEFVKNRINQWNELVKDKYKIVYRINGQIISEWKGK